MTIITNLLDIYLNSFCLVLSLIFEIYFILTTLQFGLYISNSYIPSRYYLRFINFIIIISLLLILVVVVVVCTKTVDSVFGVL